MSGDSNITPELMRQKRHSYESVFSQFISCRKFHTSYAFSFYEGEDAKYYNCRIKSKFGNRLLSFTVGDKKEVLKLFDKLKGDSQYKNLCLMFFIDKDYSTDFAQSEENLYETPYYSIENFYIQHECLVDILQAEFGLNPNDGDFLKCVNLYKEREKEFCECILEFNSLVYLRAKRNIAIHKFKLDSIKTSHIVNISMDGVLKSQKYETAINNVKAGLLEESIVVNDEELAEIKELLLKQNNLSNIFRGKNQLDFFVAFINELKILNSRGAFFSRKLENVHINITANRLSELSQYAVTHCTLCDFLNYHHNRFLQLTKSKDYTF